MLSLIIAITKYFCYNLMYRIIGGVLRMKVILKETLEKQNKSQYWLSKETGIAMSTLSRLCANKTTKVDFIVLQKICDALNCDITDILEKDDDK